MIYESDYPVPPLPTTGLFTYLLPDKPSDSPLQQFNKDLPAFIDGVTGRTITRGQLKENALRLASGIRALGLKKKDVACLWGPNSLEWAQAAFGLMAAGVTVSPANYAYNADEIAHQVNNSGSQLIFLDPALLPTFDAARKLLKRPFPWSRVVLLCTKDKKPVPSPHKCLEELYGAVGKPARFDGPEEARSTAWLCYSSGTTGLPKGVMTSNWNLTSQLQAVNVAYEPLQSGEDVVLGILPFSHIYGLTVVLLQPLTVGVPVVVLPKFEEIPVLNAIQKFKITHGLIVPPVVIILLHSQNVEKYDLSSLRTLMSGAAPLGGDTQEAFLKKFPWIKLTQGYGMTETSPVTHTMTSAETEGHVGWVGRLLPTFQARLVKEDGVDAAEGDRGELWVRGPSVMMGYHRNPEATAKTMVDDWLKTGDVLVRAKDGWYQVVDRVKELIKYKGFQVPPAELEALLLQHPKVVDAGVVGVYDNSQATELPRAYIAVAPAVSAELADVQAKLEVEAEVAAWVAERVAQHKRLRGGVCIIDAVPKSPSGKILRKDLRARAQAEFEALPARARL